MKTFSKRLFSILMLSLLVTGFVCQFASAETISDMWDDFFVQDNAHVMTYREIGVLADDARRLYNEYDNLRVMVVTITKLNDESVENAAIRIALENGMDIDGRDILVLLVVENQRIHVLLGEEIKQYISLEEVNTLIKTYAVPNFERKQYAVGLTFFQNMLINEVQNSIQPDIEKNEISATVTFAQNEANYKSLGSRSIFLSFINVLVIIIIIVIVFVFVTSI